MFVRFLLCCRGNFSAFSFVSTSASVQSELKRFVTTECDSSSMTNISLWYSYTLCLVQSLTNIDTTKSAIPFCQPLLFSSFKRHSHTGEDIVHSIKKWDHVWLIMALEKAVASEFKAALFFSRLPLWAVTFTLQKNKWKSWIYVLLFFKVCCGASTMCCCIHVPAYSVSVMWTQNN